MTNSPTLARVANAGGFPKAYTAKLGAGAIEFDHSGTTTVSNASDNYLWGSISPPFVAANMANNFTVAFWWNRKAISGTENTGACIAFNIAGDGTGSGNPVEVDSAFSVRYFTSINGFSCSWSTRSDATHSISKVASFSNKTPAVDTWTHVAFRYTRIDATTGSLELFFDGVSQQVLSGTAQVGNTIGTFTPTAMKVYMGRSSFDSNPATSPVAARMDRLRVYKTALSNFAIGVLAAQT